MFVPTTAMAEMQRFLHNTLIYLPPPPPMAVMPSGPVLNHGIDWESVQDGYLGGDIVVIDNLLSDWALEAVYAFCLEATVFYEHRPGSVGAYFGDGLRADVFERIVRAMRERLPRVILDEDALFDFWARKHHSARYGARDWAGGRSDGETGSLDQHGIDIHADRAKLKMKL